MCNDSSDYVLRDVDSAHSQGDITFVIAQPDHIGGDLCTDLIPSRQQYRNCVVEAWSSTASDTSGGQFCVYISSLLVCS